jgi:Amiloride-sensitive sodium channel
VRLQCSDYLAAHGKDESAEDIRYSSAVLQVYFSTMQSETIINVPAYDLMALLSDIGGALGLLLGATLLTVFEMTEFALYVICDIIKMRRDDIKKKRGIVTGVVKVAPASNPSDMSNLKPQ